MKSTIFISKIIFLFHIIRCTSLDISQQVPNRTALPIDLGDGLLYVTALSYTNLVYLFRIDTLNTLTPVYNNAITQRIEYFDGHMVKDNFIIVFERNGAATSRNLNVHKISIAAGGTTWLSTITFTDMNQYNWYPYPYTISGTSYIMSLPQNQQVVVDLKMKRIDSSLFDMASSANIDIIGVDVTVWFGDQKTGTQFSALGFSKSFVFDHTNVATSSIVKSFVLPSIILSMCDLEDTDFYILVENSAFRLSWSTDAVAA